MKHTVYLSLGSNIGQRRQTLQQAVRMIGEKVGTVERVSHLIETEPWGFSSPHSFLNACVCVLTEMDPHQVLAQTQDIERCLGRKHKSVGGVYHDRPIDIDILLYDDLHITTPDLVIPHPLMNQRDFVMVPLREIMPSDS